jgi:hypothetical protein
MLQLQEYEKSDRAFTARLLTALTASGMIRVWQPTFG